MTNDLRCPYCGAGDEVDTTDGFGCDESKVYEWKCSDCKKKYNFTVNIIMEYIEEKKEEI